MTTTAQQQCDSSDTQDRHLKTGHAMHNDGVGAKGKKEKADLQQLKGDARLSKEGPCHWKSSIRLSGLKDEGSQAPGPKSWSTGFCQGL